MKTVEVKTEGGNLQVLQFETLEEIKQVYNDSVIVDYFNFAFKVSCLKNCKIKNQLEKQRGKG